MPSSDSNAKVLIGEAGVKYLHVKVQAKIVDATPILGWRVGLTTAAIPTHVAFTALFPAQNPALDSTTVLDLPNDIKDDKWRDLIATT